MLYALILGRALHYSCAVNCPVDFCIDGTLAKQVVKRVDRSEIFLNFKIEDARRCEVEISRGKSRSIW